MIADPLASQINPLQTITSTNLVQQVINFDLVANGPGASTSRKAIGTGATNSGITLNCAIKHEVTGKGRRRSTFRVDVVAPVGSSFYDELNTTPRSASAYIVVDQLEAGSARDSALVDAAVSGVLNALVEERADNSVPVQASAHLLNFLNGEP